MAEHHQFRHLHYQCCTAVTATRSVGANRVHASAARAADRANPLTHADRKKCYDTGTSRHVLTALSQRKHARRGMHEHRSSHSCAAIIAAQPSAACNHAQPQAPSPPFAPVAGASTGHARRPRGCGCRMRAQRDPQAARQPDFAITFEMRRSTGRLRGQDCWSRGQHFFWHCSLMILKCQSASDVTPFKPQAFAACPLVLRPANACVPGVPAPHAALCRHQPRRSPLPLPMSTAKSSRRTSNSRVQRQMAAAKI